MNKISFSQKTSCFRMGCDAWSPSYLILRVTHKLGELMVVFTPERRCESAWSHSASHTEWLEVIVFNKTAESSAAKPCYEHYQLHFGNKRTLLCRMTFFFLRGALDLVNIQSLNSEVCCYAHSNLCALKPKLKPVMHMYNLEPPSVEKTCNSTRTNNEMEFKNTSLLSLGSTET